MPDFGLRPLFCIIQRFPGLSMQTMGLLQIPAQKAFLKIDLQLGMDLSPVLAVACPFLRDIHHCQIQHFQQAVVGRKYGF